MLKGFDEDIAGLDLSDEVKSQLIEAANKRAGGLASKNDELLSKLTNTKTQAKESQGAAEKLAAMEALQEQRELESKQQYDEALRLNGEKYTRQIEELSDKVNSFETKERNTLIGKGIQDALTDARVNPLHMEYVTTYFKQQANLEGDKVVIGDQSLSDAISEWAETDSGKAVRLAPENSGGSANGGKPGIGSGKNMTESQKRAADINKRLGRA